MSSTTSALRWLAVAALAVVLVAAALVGLPATSPSRAPSVRSLLSRALASADVEHSGSAVSTGAVGLPDLPRLSGVAALLGQTTRSRVWWRSPARWRVDELTSTGEHGTYLDAGRLETWDDEADEVTSTAAPTGAHLPRALDLEPGQVARDVLAGPGGLAAAVRGARGLGPLRVAGRDADGVSVRSRDPRSTVRSARLWVDRRSGLPLRVDLVAASGARVLTTAFDSVRVGAPAAAPLRPVDPPGAQHAAAAGDLVAQADAASPWRLPETLAGLDALVDPVASRAGTSGPGVVAYGTGLARLALLPLRRDLVARALQAARASGGGDLERAGGGDPTVADAGGQAVLIRSGAVSLAVLASGRGARGRAWVLGGTVRPAVVAAAVDQLVTSPPPWSVRR